MASESGKPANKKIKIDYSTLKEEEKDQPVEKKEEYKHIINRQK